MPPFVLSAGAARDVSLEVLSLQEEVQILREAPSVISRLKKALSRNFQTGFCLVVHGICRRSCLR